MDEKDFEFIGEMIEQLDETIRNLVLDEKEIMARLDQARIDDLRAYWARELDDEESTDLTATFDHWDKMLLFTWNRMQRAHQTRATAGKVMMKHRRITKTDRGF